MGQKINPLGFRLGTTQNHHSCWFEQPKNYSESLEEDQKIRDYIKDYVQKNIQKNVQKNKKKNVKKNIQKNVQKNRRIDSSISGITRIKIQKSTDLTEVRIYLAFPKLLKKSLMEALQTNLQKEFNCVNRKINIATTTIAKPYKNPIILAQYIAVQLKHRVPFRKAMKRAIAKAKKEEKIKGIRVQIAGRLGGKDIARVEWTIKGRVPLQTIRAKIAYCSYPVRTIHGLLGIKIWLFTDKKKKKKPFLRKKKILNN